MPDKITKANGHIVQPDWNETEETSFSFIHNKPNLEDYALKGYSLFDYDIQDAYTKKQVDNAIENCKKYTDNEISQMVVAAGDINIVQKLGDSNTNVLSQKAVTDAFETTDKRLERLESKLAPEYIVEDHETAYEKTVPYYSCSYADLERIDGATYVDNEGHLKDAKVTEIISECANLWNVDWIENSYYEKTDTGYIVKTTSQSTISVNKFFELTGLKVGDTITTSCKCKMYKGTNGGSAGWVVFISRNSNNYPHFSLLTQGLNKGERKTRTVTLPEYLNNDNYYGLYFYGSNVADSWVEFSEFIISKGDIIAPYQKYRETTIVSIPEEIQNIEGYGRVGSRLNFEDKTLNVTYGTYTYDGTEKWGTGTAVGDTGYYRYLNFPSPAPDMKKADAQDGICDRYPTHKEGWSSCSRESIRFGQAGNLIYFYLLGQKTQEEIQALTTGMSIRYPLNDESCIVHPVEIDFDCLLPVGGAATVRFENEDKQPVPSKIIYMLKEDAQFDE